MHPAPTTKVDLVASFYLIRVCSVCVGQGVSVNMPAPGSELKGMTALHFAAKSGPLALVSMLLGCNANPAQGADDGTLPIDLASALFTTSIFTRDRSGVRKLLREQMAPHIVAEGWLTKLGTERKVFRKRYCLLLPEQFRYYSDSDLLYHKVCARGH